MFRMIVPPPYSTPNLVVDPSDPSVRYMCTKLHGVKSSKYEALIPVTRTEKTDQCHTKASARLALQNPQRDHKLPTYSSVLPLLSYFNLWSDFCL